MALLLPRRRSVTRRVAIPFVLVAIAATVLAAVAVAGLGPFGGSAGGCADVRRAGLDRALEGRVPSSLEGQPPGRLDSATTCSAAGLGSLAGHGITSLTSAGGLWELGPGTGVTLAVFRLPRADRADLLSEFYATGAASAPKVTGLRTTHPTVGSRAAPATRLDYFDANFPQTIVVWPAPDPELVYVVLAAGVPDRVVDEAIQAFEASA